MSGDSQTSTEEYSPPPRDSRATTEDCPPPPRVRQAVTGLFDALPHASSPATGPRLIAPSTDRDRDFVRLYPVNAAARNCFRNVALRFQTESGWMPHARKFIEYNQNFDGYYRLNMHMPPSSGGFALGWTLGSGDPRRNSNVDLILTDKPGLHSVGQRHCRLVHHPQTNLLLIIARYDTIIDGKDVLAGTKHSSFTDASAQNESSMTVEKEMGISMGELMYVVKFTAFGETNEYVDQLNRVRSTGGNSQQPPSDTATPATHKLGIWRLWQAKWGGSYGTVSQGYNSQTGSLVVAKRVRRNLKNFDSVSGEIDILRTLSKSPHVRAATQSSIYTDSLQDNVCSLESVWPETYNNHTKDHFRKGNFDEIFLIMAPVADKTLAEFKTSSMLDWLKLFKGVCDAVAHVHSLGIMHRDIKPNNICVSGNPLRAILIDYGHATWDSSSTDHGKGTIKFLAPEVIALKKLTRGDTTIRAVAYDRAVDVWGIGISFVSRFSRDWEEIDGETWKAIMRAWDVTDTAHEEENCLRTHVRKALAWKSDDRPSALELAKGAGEFLERFQHKRKRPGS